MKKTLLLIFIGLPMFTFAQSVPFDVNFGENSGFTITDIEGNYEHFTKMAVQSDGKMVLLGFTSLSTMELVLARYTTDGLLDNTFGTNGIVILNQQNNNQGTNLKILPDDKILVLNITTWGNQHISSQSSVLRFNADGSIDNTFGNNGVAKLDMTWGFPAYELLVQQNGNIIVVGYRMDLDDNNIILSSLKPDGSVNTDFGENGYVEYDFGVDEISFCGTLINDKILVNIQSHNSRIGSDHKSYFVQFTKEGMIDSTFGANGKSEFMMGYAHATDIIVQQDGKILVSLFENVFKIVRYEANGNLDFTFGNNGLATTSFSNKASSKSIVLDAENNIYQVGFVEDETNDVFDIGVAKFKQNGILDMAFGNNGRYEFSLLPTTDEYTTDAEIIDNQLFINGGLLGKGVFIAKLNVNPDAIFKITDDANLFIYPNPIQNIATLEYRLGKNQNVYIRLFDVSGRLIQAYANETQSEGLHKLTINLANLSSGVYILNFKTDDLQKSMELMKK